MKKAIISLLLLTIGCVAPAAFLGDNPENQPFDYLGSDTCILLTHGFAGTPWEVKELGQYLNDQGYTVKGILLPGHGTTAHDLSQTTWQEWYSKLEQAYLELKPSCTNIFAGGVSTGASLSLYLAENYNISGIILMDTIIYPVNTYAYYTNILKYFVRYKKNTRLIEDEEQYYYTHKPVAAVNQLMRFIGVLKKDISKVTEPALIIHYDNDYTSKPKSAQYVYDNIQSENKELIWLNNTFHVPTKGEEKLFVFEKTEEFIGSLI
ncbi:MAG: alpha/beta hydrolase [Nanoarchaeota archaeon]|nr:alpha/beta hydrolase [Nanoarchaeota archaeon]MBU1704527.1 alpha/beta hydrolase [Nanoarchaeota archaeon]